MRQRFYDDKVYKVSHGLKWKYVTEPKNQYPETCPNEVLLFVKN